jgi:NAD(P) transhydrogenase subunit alpha
MRVAIPKESWPGERRVAVVADAIVRLAAKQLEVVVEPGAGLAAGVRDEDYRAAGARLAASREALFAEAEAVVKLRPPSAEEIALIPEGALLVSLLAPRQDRARLRALCERRVTAIAVDLVPRTTAAQVMDAQSSQATAGGYAAVLEAAHALPRFFPMLMTAAGTIAPARVLVLGAGVAGLTAIGAARRLGAVVEAFDVRRAVKEEVESLGARFVEVPGARDAAGAGGYARAIDPGEQARQAEVIAAHLAKSDACITTALVPGRRAPVLITEPMVMAMRPGSVIVDMAAEQGGNCALTEPSATVVRHAVTIVGETDFPSRVAVHASQMYSRNMERLLLHLTKDGAPALDLADEITRAVLVTRGGLVVHPDLEEAAS